MHTLLISTLWKSINPTRWALMLATAILIPLAAYTAEVRASLGSNTIPIGGYTYLSIQVEGTTRADAELPTVDGLILRDSGTSQNTSIVNGRVSKSAVIRVTVLGDKEGQYTIPAIPIVVGKETLQTEPVSITVTNAPTNQNANSQSNTGNDTLTAADIRKISQVRVQVDSTQVYVGQKVPITIELWVNTTDHRFDNLSAPNMENEHILLESLGQDYTSNIQYDGNERFEVYSWNTSFTPLKEGKTQLLSETEVTVLVRARRRTSAFDSIFDSDFFSPSYRRIPLLIKSEPLDIEIQSLPSEQPIGFSGAVGVFSMEVDANPQTVTLGDPITVNINIKGSGNFDRVFHDGLSEDSGFKTYTPETEFTPTPENPLRGEKTFKQAIIPQKPELKEIPPIQFVYFDTDTGSFKTIESPAIPITIDTNQQSATGSTMITTKTASSGFHTIQTDGWIPLQLDLDKPAASLQPLILKKRIQLLIAAIPAGILLLSFLLPAVITNRLKNQQQKLTELKRKTRPIEKELNQALAQNNQSAFIQHAASYSREVLGSIWDVSAQSITLADIRQKLSDQYPTVKEILQLHDTMQYAGNLASEIDLSETFKKLETEWKQLIEQLERS